MYEVVQAAFEWLATRVWERHGPVWGLITIFALLGALGAVTYAVFTALI